MSRAWIAAVILVAGCDRVFDLDLRDAYVDPADAAPRCPDNYIDNGMGSYRYSPAYLTWAAAQADCRADETRAVISGHTHLVVLASDAELQALTPTVTAWIGLSDLAAEGQFRWMTTEDAAIVPRFPGQPMQPPWHPFEPNEFGDEDCAAVQTTRLFYDYSCTGLLQFICECDDFESL